MKHDSMTVVVDGIGDNLKEEVGNAVKKEMSDQGQEQKPQQKEKKPRQNKQKEEEQPEAEQSEKRPKLSDRRHNDHLEHEPVSAVEGIIEEAKDNLKHAINGKVMVPAAEPEQKSRASQKDSAPAPEKKKRGPLLFNHRLFKKERWLRAKIKDNFSETAH